MRRTWLVALLFSGVLMSGCTQPPTPKTEPSSAPTDSTEEALYIGGYTVDDQFRAVPGAVVLLEEEGLRAESDDEGQFRLGPVPEGRHPLTAQHPQHESQTVHATIAQGRDNLVVFVLTPIPEAFEYQVRQFQRGFVACAIAFGQPGSFDEAAGADPEVRCGVPRTSRGQADGQMRPTVDAIDRSTHRWTLDEASTLWTSARLTTRWQSPNEIGRFASVHFAVDGCVEQHRGFGTAHGSSPLAQVATNALVTAVLENVEGTTCTEPGERCDRDACVLSSRLGPSARAVGTALLRAGAVLQQAFDQELVAGFSPPERVPHQTLK